MTYRLYNADTLNRYAKDCHQRAVAKGFWDDLYSVMHYLMLVVSELSEAVEADRKGKWAKLDHDTIDTLQRIEGESFVQMFLDEVKDTVEDEFSDTCIRLLDLLGYLLNGRGIDGLDLIALSVYEDVNPPKMITEASLRIVSKLCDGFFMGEYSKHTIFSALKSLEQLCDHLGIDLMAHIDLKLRYNETRPALHGKKY